MALPPPAAGQAERSARRAPGRPSALLGVVLALLVAVGLTSSTAPSAPAAADDASPARVEPARAAGYPVGLALGNSLFDRPAEEIAARLDEVVRAGATWVRLDLDWSTIAPEPDVVRWEPIDAIIGAAEERGLQILAIPTYTPPWARDRGCEVFTCPPADPRRYAAFVGGAAGRYTGRIAAYEIWNEPNLEHFWVGVDPPRYGRLLRLALDALASADPAATTLLGGLAGHLGVEGSTPASTFVAAACREGDCAGIDALGYHPYTHPASPLQATDPPHAWREMIESTETRPSVRRVMEEVGLAGTPIWVTEYGAPTVGRIRGDHVSEQRQGDLIAEAILTAASHPSLVGAVFVHTLRDLPRDTAEAEQDPETGYGLLRVDGTAKPAWAAFAGAAARATAP